MSYLLVLAVTAVAALADTYIIQAHNESVTLDHTIQECPLDMNCLILCDDVRTCKNTTINCARSDTGGSYWCSLVCHGQDSCMGMFLNAEGSQRLNVSCSERNACQELEINGPDEADSQIDFYSTTLTSSQRLLLHGQGTKTIIMVCTGDISCSHSTIYGPEVSDSVLDISARGEYSLLNSSVIAPSTATVSVECWSTYTCSRLELVATDASSLNVECIGQDAHSCDYAYIDGTSAASVTVSGKSLGNMQIHSEEALSASVSCTWPDGCNNAHFFCPFSADDPCTVSCSQSSTSCRDLFVYRLPGFKAGNLDFTCSGTTKNYCYNIDVYCGLNYTEFCTTGNDERDLIEDSQIICLDDDAECGYTYGPTNSPTNPSPTNAPTEAVPTTTDEETPLPDTTSKEKGGNDGKDNLREWQTVTIVVVVLVLFFLCAIIAYFAQRYLRKQHSYDNYGAHSEQVAMTSFQRQ